MRCACGLARVATKTRILIYLVQFGGCFHGWVLEIEGLPLLREPGKYTLQKVTLFDVGWMENCKVSTLQNKLKALHSANGALDKEAV